MRTHDFPGRARRAFTNDTAACLGVGASRLLARNSYSREIDMQARLKTRRTASAGVGTGGFICDDFLVVHGSYFSPGEPLNTTHQFGEALCIN